MEIFQKPTGRVEIVGVEIGEGLYEAVLKECMTQLAYLPRSEVKNLWHPRQGHVTSDTIRTSSPHVEVVEKGYLDSNDFGLV